MDLETTRNVVRAMQVASPGYREWLARAAEAAAAENQSSSGAELVAMVRSMQRTLADVTWEDAEPVLAELERGDLAMPVYGELARFVRSEVLERRARRAKQDRETAIQFASEPRYKCLHCRDTGAAHVLDPDFVSRFRTRFLAMQPEEFCSTVEGSWWRRAKDWYRREHQTGKIEYAVACDCEAGRHRQDRQCRLDGARMPVLHGILWVEEVLRAWYETHEPSDVTFWIVPEPREVEFAP